METNQEILEIIRMKEYEARNDPEKTERKIKIITGQAPIYVSNEVKADWNEYLDSCRRETEKTQNIATATSSPTSTDFLSPSRKEYVAQECDLKSLTRDEDMTQEGDITAKTMAKPRDPSFTSKIKTKFDGSIIGGVPYWREKISNKQEQKSEKNPNL